MFNNNKTKSDKYFKGIHFTRQKYHNIKCQMIKNLKMIKKMHAKQLGQLFFFKNIIQFYSKVNFKV